MNQNSLHISVLLKESIEKLDIRQGGIYVDGTLGLGGHSFEIAKKLNGNGKLISFDLDANAIEVAKQRLKEFNNITFINDNYSNLKSRIAEIGITKIDGFLIDLGVSSPQYDEPERGFSFKTDTRLDMRMNQSQKLDAYEIVNTYSVEDLKEIFYKYGQESYATKIAKQIVSQREISPIISGAQLTEVVKTAKNVTFIDKHPAKQVFQALRYAVNNELESLEKGLTDAISLLNSEARICVISFNSLEDKVIKELFINERDGSKTETKFEIAFGYRTLKTIYPSFSEVKSNPRSRSAKLRTLIKK